MFICLLGVMYRLLRKLSFWYGEFECAGSRVVHWLWRAQSLLELGKNGDCFFKTNLHLLATSDWWYAFLPKKQFNCLMRARFLAGKNLRKNPVFVRETSGAQYSFIKVHVQVQYFMKLLPAHFVYPKDVSLFQKISTS